MRTLPVFCTVPATLPCPACDAIGPVLVSVSIGRPEPGDLVICQYCEAIHIFTPELALREFTMRDLDNYDTADLARILATVRTLRAAYERSN